MVTLLRLAIPFAASTLLFLTACSVTATTGGLDTAKIQDSLAGETGESIALRCPAEIPFQAGLVSICPATADGANAVVTITQIDDKGNVDLSIGTTLNVERDLTPLIEAELGILVEIDCPPDIPLESGLVVECLVYDEESETIVTVTQTDDLGNVDWSLG
jgi:hypothetical protein